MAVAGMPRRRQAIDVVTHGGRAARGSVGDEDAHAASVAVRATGAGTDGSQPLHMDTATLIPLPDTIGAREHVTLAGDRIVVDALVLVDPGLATFLRARAEDERAELVARALRIGLVALQDAGASLDVDVVRREFEAMVRRTEALNERVTSQVDEILRANFAAGDGRLPRTLETFLGDRGQLRTLTRDLFDEDRRDSAIGRLRLLLGSYFDGDASRLAQLLDPTRLGSPLHQFRTEVARGFEQLNERLVGIEAAATARASERQRSTAKGADFEAVVEDLLVDALRGTDHVLERTADAAGDVLRSRKGDFVITLDPQTVRGATARVVVECKDRAISGRAMRDELADARRNRDAAVALVVFSAAHAPAGIAPFDIRMGDVYCVVDPMAPDPAALDAALRLARLVAASTVRTEAAGVDAAAAREALARIAPELEALRGLKMKLTTIGTATSAISAGLDQLRDAVLGRVAEAEALLRAAPAADGVAAA